MIAIINSFFLFFLHRLKKKKIVRENLFCQGILNGLKCGNPDGSVFQ